MKTLWLWADPLSDNDSPRATSNAGLTIGERRFVKIAQDNDSHINDQAVKHANHGWITSNTIGVRLDPNSSSSAWWVARENLSICCPTLFLMGI
jgi:hypothetical protein